VGDAHSVAVDVYLGLLDESGGRRTVVLAFPFFSDPQEFAVKEVPGSDLARRAAKPDRILREYFTARQRLRLAPYSLIPAFSVFCTPAALLLCALAPVYAPAYEERDLAEHRTQTYATDHSRVEIVQTSVREDLGALAQRYGLPERAKKVVARYLGKPVAIVHIRALSRHQVPSLWGEVAGSLPVLRLHFVQRMQRTSGGWRYAYPLGTGSAWETPISATSVCVLGNARRNIETRFPGEREPRGDSWTNDASGWVYVARAADGRLQVHRADYGPHNRSEDMWVILRESGSSALGFHAWLVRSGVLLILGMMFALAAASWMTGFALARWRLPQPGVGFVRACALAWILGVAVPNLLVMVLGSLVALYELVSYHFGPASLEFSASGEFAYFAAFLLLCVGLSLLVSRMLFAPAWRRQPAAWAAILSLAALLTLSVLPVGHDGFPAAVEALAATAATIGLIWVAVWGMLRLSRKVKAKVGPALPGTRTICWAAFASTVIYLVGAVAVSSLWLSYLGV
jgi:hypothetical protein